MHVWMCIDLKTAFDRVDHNITLRKLHCYGIVGFESGLDKNDLANSRQHVCYDNSNSELKNIQNLDLQAYILGQSLLMLYINVIREVSKLRSDYICR